MSDLTRAPQLLVLLTVLAMVFGCGGSSPRFTTPQSGREEEKQPDRPRFSSRESREEQAEDDVKVDVNQVRERFASAGMTPVERDAGRGNAIDRNAVMEEILSRIGTPYSYGQTGKAGLDCSAFTAIVYRKSLHRDLPRTSSDQFRVGKTVTRSSLRFGDLVFFNTTGENPSHVGIYIGDDLFAHASVTWGVTISSLQSSYFRNRFTGARRVM